jgi:alkanesulfonate monooxygenase SsuD/methylene tetrahydromethanopterin reductase-like flavin-dependent oxidoreductase (luciferase family)
MVQLNMLTFHWMNRRNELLSPSGIKRLYSQKEKFGYESILLTTKEHQSDAFITCAATLDPLKKIKYMIAVRPYSISAQYCAQMVASFNEIAPGRLMLNIVSGETSGEKKDPDPCYEVNVDINTPQGRLDYVPIWLEKFTNTYAMGKKPTILVGTKNIELLNSTKQYTDISLCMMDDYVRNPDQYRLNYNRRMVSAQVIIRNTDEEALEIINNTYTSKPRIKDWTLWGSRETVKQKIINLKDIGVTDVMLNNGTDVIQQDTDIIDQLVYEIICEQKASLS